jgi:hypothetical protein
LEQKQAKKQTMTEVQTNQKAFGMLEKPTTFCRNGFKKLWRHDARHNDTPQQQYKIRQSTQHR